MTAAMDIFSEIASEVGPKISDQIIDLIEQAIDENADIPAVNHVGAVLAGAGEALLIAVKSFAESGVITNADAVIQAVMEGMAETWGALNGYGSAGDTRQ